MENAKCMKKELDGGERKREKFKRVNTKRKKIIKRIINYRSKVRQPGRKSKNLTGFCE